MNVDNALRTTESAPSSPSSSAKSDPFRHVRRAYPTELYERLTPYCISGLRRAHDVETGIFDKQLRRGQWDRTLGTEAQTSTSICLVGVHRAGVEPRWIGMDVNRTFDALTRVAREGRYWGGLGLMIWANAVWDWCSIDSLLDRSGFDLRDLSLRAKGMTTMETAWLASGLVHEWRRTENTRTRKWAELALQELSRRYVAETRLMSHAGEFASVAHRVRRWIPNFADEIYSVQAFAFASMAFGATGDGAANAARWLGMSESVALNLSELQGPLGQWWWHYDARRGGVAQRFPVYSVHQHAMAPMALMAVTAAGGPAFDDAIRRSHEWLGRNELSVNMVDRVHETVWRDIEHDDGFSARQRRHARSLLGMGEADDAGQGSLVLNRETRPYEWAWCLYAGAIASGDLQRGHVR